MHLRPLFCLQRHRSSRPAPRRLPFCLLGLSAFRCPHSKLHPDRACFDIDLQSLPMRRARHGHILLGRRGVVSLWGLLQSCGSPKPIGWLRTSAPWYPSQQPVSESSTYGVPPLARAVLPGSKLCPSLVLFVAWNWQCAGCYFRHRFGSLASEMMFHHLSELLRYPWEGSRGLLSTGLALLRFGLLGVPFRLWSSSLM